MKGCGSLLLVCFGLFWSALTLIFDGFVLVPAVRQVYALTYRTTEGVIASSKVTRHSDGDGTTHGVDIRYRYSVPLGEIEGSRYSYHFMTSSDSAWARRAVEARPPGTKVPVYYNPTNPKDAVLIPGLTGADLFMLTFMTPFNAVMFGFWWWGASTLRQAWFKPLAGGVRIIAGPRETRARLSGPSPIVVWVVTVAGLSFCSIFIVGFLMGGFHPSMSVMVPTWGVILSGGCAAAVWHWRNIKMGKYDLIIDEICGALELPLTKGRTVRRRINFDQIRDLRVEVIEKSSGDSESTPAYVPVLELHSPGSAERLIEWFVRAKADAFVEWLRGELIARGVGLALADGSARQTASGKE